MMVDQIELVKRGVRAFISADDSVRRWLNFAVWMATAAASSYVIAVFQPMIGASIMIAALLGVLWGLMGACGASLREMKCPECGSLDNSTGETTYLHMCWNCGNRWGQDDPDTNDNGR